MGKNRERYEKIKTMYLNRISDWFFIFKFLE
jgi:cob(I)alamin adenosyltransferase